MALVGYYFVINLVTKRSSSSLFCLEQLDVGILSLTNVKIVINFLFYSFSSMTPFRWVKLDSVKIVNEWLEDNLYWTKVL